MHALYKPELIYRLNLCFTVVQVKVVVATNAAESSVTIPDCDVVICLGTHKSLQYSALNHRTQLVNTW